MDILLVELAINLHGKDTSDKGYFSWSDDHKGQLEGATVKQAVDLWHYHSLVQYQARLKPWRRYVDEHGKPYYHNPMTNTSSWDPPPAFVAFVQTHPLFDTGQRPIGSGGLPGGRMQADLSLGESGTVSEAAKSRGDYDLLVAGRRAHEKATHRLQNPRTWTVTCRGDPELQNEWSVDH